MLTNKFRSFCTLLLFTLLGLIGCEASFLYDPTPVAIVITGEPTATVPPTITPTPTQTLTPRPSPMPDWTATPTPFPCNEEVGQIFEVTDNFSEIARENLRYRVYVPPCYQVSQKRYPYVILFHGLSYREQQWDELGLDEALDQGIRLGVLPPMIVVMPWMGQIGQLNSFPPEISYETVILEELVPSIQRDFCTINDREHRAIGGISRGGFWAFSIALRNPDIFGIIGGHSAYFPNDTRAIPPAFNPLELAVNSSFVQEAGIRMYLDNGASDSSGPSQQLFSSRLSARDIAHTYVVHPVGEHNNDYWSAHVSEYLSFYSSEWEPDYNQLPSCLDPSP